MSFGDGDSSDSMQQHAGSSTTVGAAWFNGEGGVKVRPQDSRIMDFSLGHNLPSKGDHKADRTDCNAPPLPGSDDGDTSDAVQQYAASIVQIMGSRHEISLF